METALFLPIISLLLVVVAAGLVFLAFAYRQLAENFNRIHAQSDREHSAGFHKADKLIESAREQSHQMIEESEEKAQDIVIKAEFFTAASQKELGQKIEDATQKHLSEYNEMLEKFRKDLSSTFTKMSEELEDGAGKELDTFRQNIQKQTQKMETDLATQLTSNNKVAQDEIDAYKQAVIKKLDTQAQEIVKEVVKQVVPTFISNKDHEALVLQALTESKQRHAI
jgi:F0F1-type ATP synthase membrane subunit b/b'